MSLKELLKLLNKIKRCHPEAAEAEVWGVPDPDNDGRLFVISYVGFDKQHKHYRIKLEQ